MVNADLFCYVFLRPTLLWAPEYSCSFCLDLILGRWLQSPCSSPSLLILIATHWLSQNKEVLVQPTGSGDPGGFWWESVVGLVGRESGGRPTSVWGRRGETLHCLDSHLPLGNLGWHRSLDCLGGKWAWKHQCAHFPSFPKKGMTWSLRASKSYWGWAEMRDNSSLSRVGWVLCPQFHWHGWLPRLFSLGISHLRKPVTDSTSRWEKQPLLKKIQQL